MMRLVAGATEVDNMARETRAVGIINCIVPA